MGIKIDDFLDMLWNGDEEGQETMCAVVEDGYNYCLPCGTVENGKEGTLFKGEHIDMPYEIRQMNFYKWELVGNVFVFILKQ